MNRIARTSFWTIAFGLILLISVGSLSAQKRVIGTTIAALAEDTSINPHDFTNEFYEMNGVLWKSIQNRRNGSDGLSVFSQSSNPWHTDVRVIATIPAYDHYGRMLFWYPLGDIDDYGFTPDVAGAKALATARQLPIYVFPNSKLQDYRLFATTRQAALIDNTWMEIAGEEPNPLGLHEVFFVTYTEKAFGEEGLEMMEYMSKKNGLAADDTPILRTMDDLRMMMKLELITLVSIRELPATFAIAPTISDPTNGAIARDAFLWMPTKDGRPLPSEIVFSQLFGCLQKTGSVCTE
jgi:hypothetical protein